MPALGLVCKAVNRAILARAAFDKLICVGGRATIASDAPRALRDLIGDVNCGDLNEALDIDLAGTGINDGTFQLIASGLNLKRLRTLDVSGTSISDYSIRQIAGLHQLERIDLSGTAVSDFGLMLLGGCEKLEYVRLDGTAVSKEACATLSLCRPQLELAGGNLYRPRQNGCTSPLPRIVVGGRFEGWCINRKHCPVQKLCVTENQWPKQDAANVIPGDHR
jgi:hypothetical protein